MTYRIYTPLPSKNLAILTLQFDHVTVKTIYKSVKLERKDCIKDLGDLKDENLSWRKHIVTVASKISKTTGMLSKLRHFIPSSVLVNIYNALITAYLTYGLVSWGNACKTYLDKIRVLQKRALLLIYSANRQDRAIPLLLNAKVLPLNFLSCESVLNLMHDIDERNAPINILNLFSRTSNSHHYSTRSSTSQNFYIKKSRLDVQKNAFSRDGAKIWNEMPNSFKKNISRKTFRKKKLTGALLNIPKTEDN